MRTIVDIPDEQIDALREYCEQRKISRAEAVRRAISQLVDTEEQDFTAAFGSWKGHPESTDEYLARIRAEWER